MIVIFKPCKWNDSKVPKTVARVLSSLVQASEDIASVDRGNCIILLGSKMYVRYACVSLL